MTEENTTEMEATEVVDAPESEAVEAEAAPEGQQITLTVGDLTLIANVIDLAVQRGAFKGAEAQTVGAAFNKLVAIIKMITPAQPAEGDATTEAPQEGTSEE